MAAAAPDPALPQSAGVLPTTMVEATSVPLHESSHNRRVYVTFVVDSPAAAKSAPADALEQWLAFLREGVALGGPPYPKRDELYDRGG